MLNYWHTVSDAYWNGIAFYIIKLSGACSYVYEDGSANCWSFVWSVPW